MGSWNLLARRRKDKAKNHINPVLKSDTAQHGKTPRAPPKTVQKSSRNILSFPDEILILIMHQLPYGMLYILRQTCRTFHDLASDFVFNPVLLKPMIFMQTKDPGLLSNDAHAHLTSIRRYFTRQSLCEDCLPLFNDYPQFMKKLAMLWKPRLCWRCKRVHPRFFFAGRWDRTCMGQKGHFALCEHVRLEPDYRKRHARSFRPMEHRAVYADCRWKGHLYSYERLDCPKGCYVAFESPEFWGYDLPKFYGIKTIPMLKIEPLQGMNRVELQMALRKRLEDLDYLCVHASDQFDAMIHKIADTGCGCFTQNEPDNFPLVKLVSNAVICINHVYNCRRCDTTYTWKRVEDHILLDVRINCNAWSPLSIGWLTNLRYRHKRDSILNRKATKRILWCDDPNCATGSGHRWRNMIQIFHQHGLKQTSYLELPQDGRVVATPELQSYLKMCRGSYNWRTMNAPTDYNTYFV